MPLKPQAEPEDLSIDVLTNDLVNLIATVFSDVAKAPTLLVRISLLFNLVFSHYHLVVGRSQSGGLGDS